MRRGVAPLLGGLAGAGAAVAARALWFEPRSLVLRRIDVELPGWRHDGLRVAVVADLHAGAPHVGVERVREIAGLLAAERPDVLALLGDYADPNVAFGSTVSPEAVAGALAMIEPQLAAVAVLGNHDWGGDGPRIGAALAGQGIRVLEDEAVELREGLWVVGLADLSFRLPMPMRAFGEVPDEAVPLVLSHDPDLFVSLPRRPQLVLSGHTHGGQVNLPGLSSALWTPSYFGTRFTGGRIVTDGPKRLYVSRGVGTSRLPVRLRAQPEVAVLTLRSAPPTPNVPEL